MKPVLVFLIAILSSCCPEDSSFYETPVIGENIHHWDHCGDAGIGMSPRLLEQNEKWAKWEMCSQGCFYITTDSAGVILSTWNWRLTGQ